MEDLEITNIFDDINEFENTVLQDLISIIKESTSRIIQENYCTIEWLAWAGKSTLVNDLKTRFKERLVVVPELNLSSEKEQTTLNYLLEETKRTTRITSMPNRWLIIWDRSVISTMVVAAAKELTWMNTDYSNWENLKSWFSSKSNIETITFPQVFIYPSIDVDTSISRQNTREKFRNNKSIFMNSDFCINSKKIYDMLSLYLETIGVKSLCFDNSNVSEDLAWDKIFNFLMNISHELDSNNS